MEKDYTQNLLIKYLYRETDIFETLELEDALEHDFFLAEEYNMLKQSFDELQKVTFLPAKSSIQNLLAYSETLPIKAAY